MMQLEDLRTYLENQCGIRWTEVHTKDASVLLSESDKTRSVPTFRASAEKLVNGETYFFRYPIYLQILLHALNRKADRYSRPAFRVLCAGCSTGEETYSIAFALADAAKRLYSRLEILGVDLRHGAIDVAQSGIYGKWSLRNMNEFQTIRFLESVEPERWQVREPYRSLVRFQVHNLLEPLPADPFDAILICNVLLYMHDNATRTVYDNIARGLLPEGVLITAPTDPLAPRPFRVMKEFAGWPVFSRNNEPEALKTAIPVLFPSASGQNSEVLNPVRKQTLPLRRHRSRTDPAGGRNVRSIATPASQEILPQTKGQPAEPVPDEALWQAWANGELDFAYEQIRKKLFYEPEHPLWRFLNGVILWEHGWLRKSMAEMEKASSLLEGHDAGKLISGLCTAEELRRMIDFWRQQHG